MIAADLVTVDPVALSPALLPALGAGATVFLSSHVLSEVEQTCSHVVVMSRGQVIASGTVADLLAGHDGRRLEDVFLDMVGEGHTVVTS